jgi:hypothetical protein
MQSTEKFLIKIQIKIIFMEVKMKVMKIVNIMMIQMINTNKMFLINRMLLDSMFLTIKIKQINFKNLFLVDCLDKKI